jgi:glycosyltransferase involved in cell wall biosynthesis
MYPADPLGAIPGGIDTFIRGMLRWAPEDMEISLLGATTDIAERPVRKWTTCKLGKQSFRFYPVLSLTDPGKQKRIPTSLTFTLALARSREPVGADLLVFHGIEPILAFLRDPRPKTAVIHQDMQVLRNQGADIRWRYMPWLYFGFERLLMPRLRSIFCVRQNAVENYRQRFPKIADRFFFTPTWVDTEAFPPPTTERRRAGRDRLRTEFGFNESDHVLITVGRLDSQKNPMLLMESLDKVLLHHENVRLLMVGEGQLRSEIESYASSRGLEDKIVLCGVRTPETVAEYLHGADTFVLSSAYEGMPMCVLEALGCGLPVVSTDVGEVNRVVRDGVNGEIVSTHDVESFANAILRCIGRSDQYRGEPCVAAIQDFTAQKVLEPIFENYRKLAQAVST